MFLLKGESYNYGINLPTKIEEFTPEVLGQLLDGIDIPAYHVVIALCMRSKLNDIALDVNGTKTNTVTVIPLIAKYNLGDNDKFTHPIGHRAVIERSSLERGTHLSVPTVANDASVRNYLKNDDKLRRELATRQHGELVETLVDVNTSGRKKDQQEQKLLVDKVPPIFIVEFKIVGMVDIHASLPANHKLIDPFKVSTPQLAVN